MTADAVGGIWTYATGLASELASGGAEIFLVTMGPRPRPDQRAMLSASNVHLIESELALEWQDPEALDLNRAQSYFKELEKLVAPDLVHLNGFREATFQWQSPVVVVAHSCVNSWAIACKDTAWISDPRWRNYSELVRAGLRKAHAWVCPTRAFHDVISELYRPAIPGRVIWNGVKPRPDIFAPKRPFIVGAGRMWDGAKNVAALAAASRDLDWPLFVAGTGALPSSGSLSDVRWLGDIPHAELQKRMQHAAVFASPALYEPFGLSVLEAASSGCALVLTDIPSFRELWDGAALFVDPENPSVLHEALRSLCADAARRKQLQEAGFQRSKRYSSARMARAYGELYASLLSSRPRTAHREIEACA